MPLVKLIKNDGRDPAQLRVGKKLSKENTLGHIADLGLARDMRFHTNLIAHLTAERFAALEGHALGQQPCRQPARLKHHHLARASHPAIKHHLRHLRRLP